MNNETLTPIATFLNDPAQVASRVTLYLADGDVNIWAAAPDEDPHRTDVRLIDMLLAWSDPAWDMRTFDT